MPSERKPTIGGSDAPDTAQQAGRAHASAGADEFVFATDSGRPSDKDSVRERVPVPVVKRVNEIGVERAIAPLSKITPQALRRTYISLMLEAGAPLPYVMDQVGHADSKTTLAIYAQAQKRVSRKNVHAAFDRGRQTIAASSSSKSRPLIQLGHATVLPEGRMVVWLPRQNAGRS